MNVPTQQSGQSGWNEPSSKPDMAEGPSPRLDVPAPSSSPFVNPAAPKTYTTPGIWKDKVAQPTDRYTDTSKSEEFNDNAGVTPSTGRDSEPTGMEISREETASNKAMLAGGASNLNKRLENLRNKKTEGSPLDAHLPDEIRKLRAQACSHALALWRGDTNGEHRAAIEAVNHQIMRHSLDLPQDRKSELFQFTFPIDVFVLLMNRAHQCLQELRAKSNNSYNVAKLLEGTASIASDHFGMHGFRHEDYIPQDIAHAMTAETQEALQQFKPLQGGQYSEASELESFRSAAASADQTPLNAGVAAGPKDPSQSAFSSGLGNQSSTTQSQGTYNNKRMPVVTDVGYVVSVKELGSSRKRFIINEGTLMKPVWVSKPGSAVAFDEEDTDFEPMVPFANRIDVPKISTKNIDGVVQVKSGKASGNSTRQPITYYLIKHDNGVGYCWMSHSEVAAVMKKAIWLRDTKLRDLLKKANEIAEEIRSKITSGLHPDTNQPLTEKDRSDMPWLFREHEE